ncbi:MAG: amino acid-binding protein [Actinobacteria bacterium]|nr:amino acid-binding protein [Actinomycetota bacterium]
MAHLAVSAIGSDRPGIVAAVTKVLLARGCNLEDTSMSILRGHFAMMLVVAAPPDLAAADLEQALAGPAADFDLVVAVRAIDDNVPDSPPGETWAVSVHGADRPGIVHRVTAALADGGANVVDLSTRLVGEAANPVYVMVLSVTLPAGADGNALGQRLDELGRELGVDIRLHRAEPDVL